MALALCSDILVSAVLILLGVAAFRDVAIRSIPNLICAMIVALGGTLRVVNGDWASSLFATCCVFGLAIACWSRGWLGGGDVKLLSAAALVVPATSVPALIAAITMAGGVLSILYLSLSRVIAGRQMATGPSSGPRNPIARMIRVEQWRVTGRRSLPYACAIMAGTFITLPNG